jgi:serine protease AprX
MTGAIAAGTTASGGRYNGVAPDSPIIACKTSFDDTELYQIYDYLIQLVDSKQIGRLVVSNSYGSYICAPPPVTRDDPFPSIVSLAVSKGVVVVFAAGNNHVVVCGNDPTQCTPNTIWGANSMDEILSVGTVNRNNRMDQPPAQPGDYCHRDSSRGPGQLASATTKPDCVAPTYGEVMWGCGYSAMEWWGTSGAAPQVAGLAALILSKNSSLTPSQVQTIIKGSCVNIGLAATCAGAGLIDCVAAVNAAWTDTREMNGFVQFKQKEDLEDFLAMPEVASIRASGRLSTSSSQPVLILKELSPEDLSEIRTLAESHGGRVKPSTQYEPLWSWFPSKTRG